MAGNVFCSILFLSIFNVMGQLQFYQFNVMGSFKKKVSSNLVNQVKQNRDVYTKINKYYKKPDELRNSSFVEVNWKKKYNYASFIHRAHFLIHSNKLNLPTSEKAVIRVENIIDNPKNMKKNILYYFLVLWDTVYISALYVRPSDQLYQEMPFAPFQKRKKSFRKRKLFPRFSRNRLFFFEPLSGPPKLKVHRFDNLHVFIHVSTLKDQPTR